MREWIMLLYTWNKKTNTLYNIVSHIYTNTKYKLQKENADAIPFRLSDLGCCHIPEA